MNGSLFVESSAWPLGLKMAATNFPASTLSRVDQLPPNDIAWFNPGRHPAQGVIAISSSTQQEPAGSEQTRQRLSRLRAMLPEALSRLQVIRPGMQWRKATERRDTL